MQRCNIRRQLVDHLCIHLGCRNLKCILAGLLDSGDIRGGFTGRNTDCKFFVAIHQIGKLRASALRLGHRHHVSVILLDHGIEEVHCGCIALEAFITVVGSHGGDGIAFLVQAVGDTGIYDFFYKSFCSLVIIGPEFLLLILGPLGEIFVILSRLGH